MLTRKERRVLFNKISIAHELGQDQVASKLQEIIAADDAKIAIKEKKQAALNKKESKQLYNAHRAANRSGRSAGDMYHKTCILQIYERSTGERVFIGNTIDCAIYMNVHPSTLYNTIIQKKGARFTAENDEYECIQVATKIVRKHRMVYMYNSAGELVKFGPTPYMAWALQVAANTLTLRIRKHSKDREGNTFKYAEGNQRRFFEEGKIS